MEQPSRFSSCFTQPALWAGAALLYSGPAVAHHVMDSKLPQTFAEGLLSGLGHPVIGIDHLSFIVAVGLLSAAYARGYLLPLGFLLSVALGVVLHLFGIELPANELFVAASVLLLRGLILGERRVSPRGLVLVTSAAGLFHGYAYGESIVGAEASPLLAYFAGFTGVQYAIALAAYSAARAFSIPPARYPAAQARFAGLPIIAIGVAAAVAALGA